MKTISGLEVPSRPPLGTAARSETQPPYMLRESIRDPALEVFGETTGELKGMHVIIPCEARGTVAKGSHPKILRGYHTRIGPLHWAFLHCCFLGTRMGNISRLRLLLIGNLEKLLHGRQSDLLRQISVFSNPKTSSYLQGHPARGGCALPTPRQLEQQK